MKIPSELVQFALLYVIDFKMHEKLSIKLLTIGLLLNFNGHLVYGKSIERSNNENLVYGDSLANGRNGNFSNLDFLSGLGSGLLANEGVGFLATLWIKLVVAAFIIWIWWGGYYQVDNNRRHSQANYASKPSYFGRNMDLDSIAKTPSFKISRINQSESEISSKERLENSSKQSATSDKNFMHYIVNLLAKFVVDSIDQS